MATFDGDNLIITLDAPVSGVVNLRVQRLYSEWKEWQTASFQNMGYPPAFSTFGGNALTASTNAGSYYVFNNSAGWRIKTTEADQTVYVEGNLVPLDTDLPTVTATTGAFNVLYLGLQPVVEGISGVADGVLRIIRATAYRQFTNAGTNNLDIYDDTDTLIQSVPIYEDDGLTGWDGTGGILRRDRID